MLNNLPHQIASRICHDLASPLGAIANGLELLEMSEANKTPEMALISDSVSNAVARLELFRLAFGHAAADQHVSALELKTLVSKLSNTRLTFEWEAEGRHPRTDIKLAALLLQCLESAAPRGGIIHVAFEQDTWVMMLKTKTLLVNPDHWPVLNDISKADKIAPSHIHFLMAALQSQDCGRQLRVTQENGEDADTLAIQF